MEQLIKLQSPDLFDIYNGKLKTYGANQEWYKTPWQRKAGCGPTACSHLMWYLSRTRPECAGLCCYDGHQRQDFIRLMEDVWEYVTPGAAGVNRTELFSDGAIAYARSKDVELKHLTIQIPGLLQKRPDWIEIRQFLIDSFKADLPVAFLNLSNGALKNLDSWHWVTLTGIDTDHDQVQMYDQGIKTIIDLKKWLKTTLQGGGFVVLSPVY